MGAWGSGIRQDDLVLDVIGEFEDALKAGKSVAAASEAVALRYRSAVAEPSYWIALAEMQWTYGTLDASVLERVRDDLASGHSLEQWEDDPPALTRRRAELEKFVKKISQPRPRPARRPTPIVRAPKFRAGDCLSIQLPSGEYGAALVLAATHSTPEYGKNLVGLLDYRSNTPPTLDVFRGRRWRRIRPGTADHRPHIGWYEYIGFRKVRPILVFVGSIEIRPDDPADSAFLFGWGNIASVPPTSQD
jgi:hypothetical protein